MEYKASEENGMVFLFPQGDIKTTDSKGFEDRMLMELRKTGRLTVDFSVVGYICSAGLRALLAVQQAVDEIEKGEFRIRNVGNEVMSVLRSTGFQNVLIIENTR